ncbi:MAG TPA: hypothetical protein VNX47_00230 [Nevskia sp.]|nr:hypothetical protein [Nevskia sp.]
MNRILALVLLVFAPLAHADEQALQASIREHAKTLMLQRDLASFDRLAGEYRDSREETPAGFSKLSLLYNGIEDIADDPRDPAWTRARVDADAWLLAHADSPSAVIIAAEVLVKKAWAVRGHGMGDTVAADQFERFDTLVEEARRTLDEHQAAGEKDPEWFALRISVANWQGDDRHRIMSMALRAAAREPNYLPIHYAAMSAMQPKWGGSTALSREYLDAALPLSAPRQGRQLYARVYLYMLRHAGDYAARELEASGAQWPDLKASMQQIVAAYPDAWNANSSRILACAYGTAADYKQAMAVLDTSYGGTIVPIYPIDTAGWRLACHDWAENKAPHLEPPAPVMDDGHFYRRIAIWVILVALLAAWNRARSGKPQAPAYAGAAEDPAPEAMARARANRDAYARRALIGVAAIGILIGIHEFKTHQSGETDRAYALADDRAAFAELGKSVAAARTAGQQPTAQMWIDYANAAWGVQRRDVVDQALEQLEWLQPQDGRILSQMGYLYIGEKRMPQAWKAVQKGAALNDTWSQYAVAKTLYLGCGDINLKADPEAAMVWFHTAATLGDAQAAKVLKVETWGHTLTWLYLIFH